MNKSERLLCLIEVAVDLGVGSEEEGDEGAREYSRGAIELIAQTFWSSEEFLEAKEALTVLFYKLNGEE